MKYLFSVVFLTIASMTWAVPQNGFLCEDSPLDIPPDVFFTCEAIDSFDDGFDKHALELFKRASLWGSKEAQYRVGLMYLGGYGAEVDLVEGSAWLLLANERNSQQVTEKLSQAMDLLTEEQIEQANLKAKTLREHYGDFKALERRARWVRRMKNRTTGSRLGKPNASIRLVGTNGVTGDQKLSRLDAYEASLRNVLTTVEYRDFDVIDDEEIDSGQSSKKSSNTPE